MPTKPKLPLEKILGKLESTYGAQKPGWPVDPYTFLVWWHCGYPASDKACGAGFESLKKCTELDPEALLKAPIPILADALKPGGMVPELRAVRLKEIASRVLNEFSGNLKAGLRGQTDQARKILKTFPNIADPGAERILLFARLAPVAAVPSNCPHVLVRIRYGQEHKNYGRTYREAQQVIEAETPAEFEERQRAYLLLKRHGQEICKANNPKCPECPVRDGCAYYAGHYRGRKAANAAN